MIIIYIGVVKACVNQLLNDVEVQSLLHGTTTTAQNGDKAIYQPGALRKVWIYEA